MEVSKEVQEHRVATEREVELAVESVWGYVRTHAHSLDSERATKKIMEMAAIAVSGVHRRLEAATDELTECRKTLRVVRTDNRGLVGEIERLTAETSASRDKLKLLTSMFDGQMQRKKFKALEIRQEEKKLSKKNVEQTPEQKSKLASTVKRVRDKFKRQEAKRKDHKA